MADKKTMYVGAYDVDTGETWEVSTTAKTPEDALGTALRRKTWAAFLLSGHAFRFTVGSLPRVDRPRMGRGRSIGPDQSSPSRSGFSAYVDFEAISGLVAGAKDGTMAALDANSGLRSIENGVRRIDDAIGSATAP